MLPRHPKDARDLICSLDSSRQHWKRDPENVGREDPRCCRVRPAPPSARKRSERETMTKADLIESLSYKLGVVKIDAERVVDGVLDAIVEALKQGDPVNISGFGRFAVSMRKARPGRNPKSDRDFGGPIGEVQARQATQGLA